MTDSPQHPQHPQLLTLRPFADADIDLFAAWLRRPHVWPWFGPDEADWLDEVANRRDKYAWLHHYIAEYQGRAVGFAQYYDYATGGETWFRAADMSRVYGIDYLLGEADVLRRGLGKALVSSIVALAARQTPARLLEAQAHTDNLASRRTLLACGFAHDQTCDCYVFTVKG